MTSTLILLFALAGAALWWLDARDAAERARHHALAACRRAGVQLLDQTVSLQRMQLARNSDGRLRLRRRYGYDYSPDGVARERGLVVLLGNELESVSEPAARII